MLQHLDVLLQLEGRSQAGVIISWAVEFEVWLWNFVVNWIKYEMLC